VDFARTGGRRHGGSVAQLGDPNGDTKLVVMTFRMAPDKVGTGRALVKMEGVPSGGNSTQVYFSCADCAVEDARVAAAGGKILRDKRSIGPNGAIVLAVDTEGNMFGLHSM
jgi:predicted enzyme related to lactoylglutathione lyase